MGLDVWEAKSCFAHAAASDGGKFANGAVTGAFAYAAEASYSNDAAGNRPNAASATAGPNVTIDHASGNFSWGIQTDYSTIYPGIVIGIQYNDDPNDVQWIQTYVEHGYTFDGLWHFDGDQSGAPFYDFKDGLKQPPGRFYDNPQVTSVGSSDFTAIVQAVRAGPSGSLTTLGMFTYGFNYANGVVRPTTLVPISPMTLMPLK